MGPLDHITLALIRTYDHEILFGWHTKTCGYSVRCVKNQEDSGINEKGLSNNPQTFQLYPNYPNPFNPSTTICFNLAKSENVQLKILNIHGQEIQTLLNDELSAGEHSVEWQADGLPAGIYLARLQAESEIKTMKLVLQK